MASQLQQVMSDHDVSPHPSNYCAHCGRHYVAHNYRTTTRSILGRRKLHCLTRDLYTWFTATTVVETAHG